MPLIRKDTNLAGLSVIETSQFHDNRGYFWEIYNSNSWKEIGLELDIVQANQSGSRRNVVRGLHFQWSPPMGKLMRVATGAAFLVAVDIRPNSPTLGQWYGLEASSENKLQLWGEAGFARGFCALTDYAEVQYLCTGNYNGACESGFQWNDPDVGVKWPVDNPIVSDKDNEAQSFKAWLARPEAQAFAI